MTYTIDRDDLPPDCIVECSAQGRVDAEVDYWQRKLAFTVPRDEAIEGLARTGGWTREELAAEDDDTLARRVLWIAACTFREGDDLVVLE